MKPLARTTFDPNVMGGKPCIRGLRVTQMRICANRSSTMILRIVMALCLVMAAMSAAVEVNAQKEADRLRDIEKDRLRSLVDADIVTAGRLHADDFQLINPNGGTLSKEQYLRDVSSGDLDYILWEPEDIQVRLYGKAAVLRYKAQLRVSVKGSAGRPVTFWHTDLYEKRKGDWQIVWSHATLLQPR